MKIFLLLFLISVSIFGQSYNVSGIVTDSITGSGLGSANIYLKELEMGASTNENGEFKFNSIDKGNYSLTVSYLGYQMKRIKLNLNKDIDLRIKLNQITLDLENLLIEGTYPKFRETAGAFSELTGNDISRRLGTKEAANILEGTPSAFISQQGGGIGEQRLNIRGFDQTNISVMLNGVPLNNPENGEIYWSNWAGISDIIQFIHVQRGLSTVPYSTSSIGGNVNFITLGNFQNPTNIKFKTEVGSFNLKKNSLSISTSLDAGLRVTGFISKRDLDGYADQIYSDELTYYLALSLLRENHSLQIQFLGSPQKHGQRLTSQSINTWSIRGKKYNADWGYLNGKSLNLRDNEFHNPTLNFNYNWQIDQKLMLTNILTLSRGYGGGTVPPWYPELSRTEKGLIEFDREWSLNSTNIDNDFHPSLKRSIIALRKGVHKNYWGTLITSLKYQLNNYSFIFGFDGKLYEAQNYNELSNMLGGDYYIGSNDINSDPNKLLFLGDKVDFYADSFTRSFGGFAQVEYQSEKINAYLNLALSSTSYNRIDYFNYLADDPNRETGWKNFVGSTFKTGLNINLDQYHNIYVNIGNFSRPPLSNNVFDYSNNLYANVKNEHIISFEGGYGFNTKFLKANLNYYNTVWNDKAFSQTYLNSDSTTLYYYNIFGASARHSGIELEGTVFISNGLSLNTALAYATHKWDSDVEAYLRPESNPEDEIKYNAFTKGLYVGNHPMASVSLGLLYGKRLSPNMEIFINPIWSYFDKYYAEYDPELRTDISEKGVQPWRLPSFSNLDVHAGVNMELNLFYIKSIDFTLNVFNVFDKDYIIDATDGIDHDASSARVWYGNKRWWSASLTLSL